MNSDLQAEVGKNTKTLFKAGAIGALAGTAMGLATLPAHKSAKSTLLGSSIGLYLGLAAGAFQVYQADESAPQLGDLLSEANESPPSSAPKHTTELAPGLLLGGPKSQGSEVNTYANGRKGILRRQDFQLSWPVLSF